ncbi:hypothetical protein GOBAR_AA28409 [Gossypium barbadense]|uniref:Transcriptional corepressor SEUSS n=1 Tax=Gossypium barbadense TaxID=3634 RepID=A0A2P5WME8_GOSBA|nr:hypothetical protein GOBAR_AA28409 [Gossypium barbadense]
MVPLGPSTPIGGAQSVPSSLLRTNSGMLGSQGGGLPSQSGFPSLVSPRTQFNNMNMLGNVPNVSSLLNQSFGNGGPNPQLSGPGSGQRGGIDSGAESDPLSNVGTGMGFNAPSSFVPSNMANPGSSGQVQGQQYSNLSGNHILPDQQQPQQPESQQFQHGQQGMQQVSAPHNTQQGQLQQQQQFQSIRGGMAGVGAVKLEPQLTNDQHSQPQQLQSLRNLAPVKLEPQQIPPSRTLAQLQQQHHHQQLLKAMPQQRPQLPQQFQQQNLSLRSPVKSAYEPGMCARRLTHYMYQQQHRPEVRSPWSEDLFPHDNNIEFWRKFVAEYFAPNAKKKWCVSMYGNGRQTTGVFPQDVWHCEICNRKPGRGFEATVEVLPRLFKIKYESGTLEELLYVDMPREYQNSSGQIVLDYAKAIQESVFEQLRVVRDGQLRIVFSPDLKLYLMVVSWVVQVSQLGAAAQKYQAATQIASTNLSAPDLQNNCNLFVASARQLAKALEVPLVNDLGYTKRYVRCLQISEVVNSMKDLIDYSRETRTGPMVFPQRVWPSSLEERALHLASGMQLAANNGVANVNNSLNVASASTSAGTIAGPLHQNSMNSRQQNSMNSASSPYGGNSVQIPSPGSSSTIPQTQANPSPFQSPTPSSSNNPPQALHGALAASSHMSSANSPAMNMPIQQPALSSEADPNESQSSAQKIIHEIMSSQLNNTGGMVGAGTLGNDVKSINGMLPPSNNTVLNGGNTLVGNGTISNNSVIGGVGFGSTSGGLGQSAMVNGIRATMGNNPVMNGRMGMAQMARDQLMNHQQQDMGNQLLNGLGALNAWESADLPVALPDSWYKHYNDRSRSSPPTVY